MTTELDSGNGSGGSSSDDDDDVSIGGGFHPRQPEEVERKKEGTNRK